MHDDFENGINREVTVHNIEVPVTNQVGAILKDRVLPSNAYGEQTYQVHNSPPTQFQCNPCVASRNLYLMKRRLASMAQVPFVERPAENSNAKYKQHVEVVGAKPMFFNRQVNFTKHIADLFTGKWYQTSTSTTSTTTTHPMY